MWSQVAAIIWAQFRITRNHLPRTNVGAILLGFVGLVWYGAFTFLSVMLVLLVGSVPIQSLQQWLPTGLLAVFAFWQLVPLFTLSGGWSLHLNRLLPYPIRHRTLFTIEALLRVTTAPEMIIVIIGVIIGLLRNPAVGLTAFALLLYIPFNLFVSLAIRETMLQAFARNKFREIFTIFIVTIGIIPQLLIRTPLGKRVLPYLLHAANGVGTPWREVAVLSLGSRMWYTDLALLALWTYVCYWLARRQFERGLVRDQAIRANASSTELAPGRIRQPALFANLPDLPNHLFKDPLAALIQKEYRSLLRMPRFRVLFGMACFFGVLVFIPMTLGDAKNPNSFMRNNFLVVTTLYGLLIISESLLLNVFGFDRLATQIYFLSPIPFRSVLTAKNLTAAAFVLVQSVCVAIAAAVVRIAVTPINVLNSILAAAVVGVFYLAIGNTTSIALARPMNPAETFRKQSGGKMQLWFLLCSVGMCVLVGFALLARWALDNDWAMSAVLAVELIVGYIVYRVATDAAVEKAELQREQLIDALSKGAGSSVLGLSSS
jgi:ABC-2 type transport system permease protein